MIRWPFALRSTVDSYRALAEERAASNRLLRDALKEANAEIRRHRILLSTIRTSPEAAVKRIIAAFHGVSPDGGEKIIG